MRKERKETRDKIAQMLLKLDRIRRFQRTHSEWSLTFCKAMYDQGKMTKAEYALRMKCEDKF